MPIVDALMTLAELALAGVIMAAALMIGAAVTWIVGRCKRKYIKKELFEDEEE